VAKAGYSLLSAHRAPALLPDQQLHPQDSFCQQDFYEGQLVLLSSKFSVNAQKAHSL
jgi:hypothetical protein